MQNEVAAAGAVTLDSGRVNLVIPAHGVQPALGIRSARIGIQFAESAVSFRPGLAPRGCHAIEW